MFSRSVSTLLTDQSVLWMIVACVCTLVTELTSRRNRPLIPVPATRMPWGIGSTEYSY